MTNRAAPVAAPVPAPPTLSRYVEEHPVGAVVAAFGLGYVVSGALFSKTTLRVVGFGLQLGLRSVAPVVIRAALESSTGNGRKPPVSRAPKEEAG
jgi:hypothetical protein